jgi:hypothetical protein
LLKLPRIEKNRYGNALHCLSASFIAAYPQRISLNVLKLRTEFALSWRNALSFLNNRYIIRRMKHLSLLRSISCFLFTIILFQTGNAQAFNGRYRMLCKFGDAEINFGQNDAGTTSGDWLNQPTSDGKIETTCALDARIFAHNRILTRSSVKLNDECTIFWPSINRENAEFIHHDLWRVIFNPSYSTPQINDIDFGAVGRDDVLPATLKIGKIKIKGKCLDQEVQEDGVGSRGN